MTHGMSFFSVFCYLSVGTLEPARKIEILARLWLTRWLKSQAENPPNSVKVIPLLPSFPTMSSYVCTDCTSSYPGKDDDSYLPCPRSCPDCHGVGGCVTVGEARAYDHADHGRYNVVASFMSEADGCELSFVIAHDLRRRDADAFIKTIFHREHDSTSTVRVRGCEPYVTDRDTYPYEGDRWKCVYKSPYEPASYTLTFEGGSLTLTIVPIDLRDAIHPDERDAFETAFGNYRYDITYEDWGEEYWVEEDYDY